MKVGNVPVVSPFSLCIVAVGGSAIKGRRKAFGGDGEVDGLELLWKGDSEIVS